MSKPKAGTWEHIVVLQNHIRELEETLREVNRDNIRLRSDVAVLGSHLRDAQHEVEVLEEVLKERATS